jgi:hypothetical protein
MLDLSANKATSMAFGEWRDLTFARSVTQEIRTSKF